LFIPLELSLSLLWAFSFWAAVSLDVWSARTETLTLEMGFSGETGPLGPEDEKWSETVYSRSGQEIGQSGVKHLRATLWQPRKFYSENFRPFFAVNKPVVVVFVGALNLQHLRFRNKNLPNWGQAGSSEERLKTRPN
jgi:hypothetical protein